MSLNRVDRWHSVGFLALSKLSADAGEQLRDGGSATDRCLGWVSPGANGCSQNDSVQAVKQPGTESDSLVVLQTAGYDCARLQSRVGARGKKRRHRNTGK